ncbi:MAG: wax ester/triacylglycerol synthase family O-acyltransferase [Nocardioides sp.]|uniref:WS/DGAT/MGAT family O-acyltransferase n=1 Tax=Nocardioides sp. TaxID=35761 RepID=UPI0039E37968
MSDRLSPRDLAFLVEESPTSPRHVLNIDILDPGEPVFDYDAFRALVADRLAFVPRYRQRVQLVPGRLANPVWVDDTRFDLDYHIRRSALPRPGSLDQLRDLAAWIMSRQLDRSRPLWEMYVVEGLADGRVALIAKTHQALVDGVEVVELGQLLLDVRPSSATPVTDDWSPRGVTGPGLVLEAMRDSLSGVDTLSQTARTTGAQLAGRATRALAGAVSLAGMLLGRRPERPTPLTGTLSEQRLFVPFQTELADFRRIRDVHGGTVNDVILAVVTGGLRGWLMTRSESLAGLRQVPAVVPVSVIDGELEATALGSQIAPHFVELPVGETSPVVRLHQVSYSFEKHKETARVVGADRLAGITGFAPATFHMMGARVAARAEGDYLISVCNVPGPQTARYCVAARLVASYPVHPLEPGHSLAIGVTSYDGKVFFGLTADRDLVPDASVLGQCLREALDELLDTATGARQRAPRGRSRNPRRRAAAKDMKEGE